VTHAGDERLAALRQRTRALCARFPDAYWRETDRDRRYPRGFVDTLDRERGG